MKHPFVVTLTALFTTLFTTAALAQTLDMWSWRTEDVEAYNRILEAYQEPV